VGAPPLAGGVGGWVRGMKLFSRILKTTRPCTTLASEGGGKRYNWGKPDLSHIIEGQGDYDVKACLIL
jgi:hypothetical protein